MKVFLTEHFRYLFPNICSIVGGIETPELLWSIPLSTPYDWGQSRASLRLAHNKEAAGPLITFWILWFLSGVCALRTAEYELEVAIEMLGWWLRLVPVGRS